MEKIAFDKAELVMLFELVSKAGVVGSDAATLGSLYSKVKAAHDRANPQRVPPKVNAA